MLKIIVPDNKDHWLEMRRAVLTSTEIAALFDASPYVTKFELYHRKKNNVEIEFDPSERVIWGSRLEKSVAEGVAEDNGLKIRKMDEFIFDDILRIGASFDYSIETDPLGILEIKCVDSLRFKNEWIVDGDSVEATPQIELQVQAQMLVSGRSFAWIAALIGGNKVVLIKRNADQKIHAAIKAQAAAFWKSIEEGVEPKPDFSRDAQFVAKLYGYAEPNKIFDAANDPEIAALMNDYEGLMSAEKTARQGKDEIKAKILMKIGDAEKVLLGNGTISCGVIGPTEIPAHTRKGYRNFKAYFKRA